MAIPALPGFDDTMLPGFLRVGQQRVYTCASGWREHRRELLRVGTLAGLGGLSGEYIGPFVANSGEDLARTKPARAVILLWLWGGPPHMETFDPKPHAPSEYRGPFSAIATNVPGTFIGEMLPQLSQRADRYTIIRSMGHNNNDHGIAGTIGLTGADFGAISLGGQTLPGRVLPTHGAIVSRFPPVEGQARGLPPFVTLGGFLHQGKRRIAGEDAGALGTRYDPFRLDYDLQKGLNVPQLQLTDGMTPDGLSNRRQLLANIDKLARHVDHSPRVEEFHQLYGEAFELLSVGKARAVFDLEREPEELRLQYGKFRFGQCCLLARRLIEAGVRFVQVNWSSHVEPVEDTGDGGWDMHDRNFIQFQERHGWMLDQALSALLDDLHDRGLADDIIVLALGEFGRTPKINNKSGRDHWEHCYSALVAGGGWRCGQVIGASDKFGEHPTLRPVTPADLALTMLDRLGIGSPQLAGAGLMPLGHVIEEL